MHDNMKIKGRQ